MTSLRWIHSRYESGTPAERTVLRLVSLAVEYVVAAAFTLVPVVLVSLGSVVLGVGIGRTALSVLWVALTLLLFGRLDGSLLDRDGRRDRPPSGRRTEDEDYST